MFCGFGGASCAKTAYGQREASGRPTGNLEEPPASNGCGGSAAMAHVVVCTENLIRHAESQARQYW